MNKEFIPYEQALALKELGFDEQCFGYYYTLNGKDWKFADDKQYDSLDEFYNIGSMCTILAPLYQQVFRWFRENHSLFPYVEYFLEEKFDYVIVSKMYDKPIDYLDGKFDNETTLTKIRERLR